MKKIFVSYANQDRQKVRTLLSQLRNLSLEGWLDTADLTTGEAVGPAIRDAIRQAAGVIVLLSPQSASNKWIQFEIGAAEALGKPIIPVIVEGEDVEQVMPDSLRGTAALDARSRSPVDVAREIEKILAEAEPA